MRPDEAAAAQAARWPALDDFLARLADVGERLGVAYLIENQPYTCPLWHDPALLAEHVAAVDSPHIRMCFDTGHAHLTGGVAPALRACAGVLSYIHVHDNSGTADQHLMPGDGTIEWLGDKGVAQALADHARAVPRMLEVFYPPERLEQLAAGGLADQLQTLLALEPLQ